MDAGLQERFKIATKQKVFNCTNSIKRSTLRQVGLSSWRKEHIYISLTAATASGAVSKGLDI